jgi:predicted LPLAT superfamily acyltransferase
VFGQCILDRFAVYAGRRNFFNVEIIGNEHYLSLLNEEKGFIVASSHVGNFELIGYLLRQDKKRTHTLVFGEEAKEIMTNRAKSLQENNVEIIPASSDMSHVFKLKDALQNGDIVSMPSDRNFGSAKTVECDFLNGKADFPQGTFVLATTMEVPIIAIFSLKKSFSKYIVYVKPLSQEGFETLDKREKNARLAQSFASELEIILQKYPEQWFNFYDFWK